MTEEIKDAKEDWEPPTDWSDARKVRAWLKLFITNYSFAGEMLESAVHVLGEVVRCEQEALPPLPEGEAEPQEPPHKKLVDYLKAPPEAETVSKKSDEAFNEPLLVGQGGSGRWKPDDWTNVQQARSWLTIHAGSRDNFATQLEGIALMLRRMSQMLRDARPPWPVEPPDTPPSKT